MTDAEKIEDLRQILLQERRRYYVLRAKFLTLRSMSIDACYAGLTAQKNLIKWIDQDRSSDVKRS